MSDNLRIFFKDEQTAKKVIEEAKNDFETLVTLEDEILSMISFCKKSEKKFNI